MTSKSNTQAAPPALAQLLHEPGEHGFLETVRLLSGLRPAAAEPGKLGPYGQEAVHFRHNANLEFGAGEVTQVNTASQGRFEVKANFLGLSGESSPIPQYLFESLGIPGQEQDVARHYLDIFHHRFYGFLYRGLNELEVADQDRKEWLDRLLCFLGLEEHHIGGQAALTQHELLQLAPLLAVHAKSRRSIEQGINHVLHTYLDGPFEVPAKATVHDFEGQLTTIDQDTQLELGTKNHSLGQASLLGRRVQHRAARARIEIGILHPSQQRHFERGRQAYNKLAQLLSLCILDPIEFDLDLKIRYERPDHCTLGASRLSVNSIISGSTHTSERRVVYRIDLPGFHKETA